MAAKTNHRGQVELRATAHGSLDLRPGDTLVVVGHDRHGHILLQKRPVSPKKTSRHKSYLNPRPLPAGVLERIYGRLAPAWDKVEAEAVAVGRRRLAGKRLEEL